MNRTTDRQYIWELHERGVLKAKYTLHSGQFTLQKGPRKVIYYSTTGTVVHLGKNVGQGLSRALRIIGGWKQMTLSISAVKQQLLTIIRASAFPAVAHSQTVLMADGTDVEYKRIDTPSKDGFIVSVHKGRSVPRYFMITVTELE